MAVFFSVKLYLFASVLSSRALQVSRLIRVVSMLQVFDFITLPIFDIATVNIVEWPKTRSTGLIISPYSAIES